MNEIEKVRAVIRELNAAWLNGAPEQTGKHLHPDVVFVPPGFSLRVQGREACVKSYVEFVANARVLDFEPAPETIHVCGPTAVADCPFTIAYEAAGKQCREAGRDLLVFCQEGGEWRIVWRTMMMEG